MTQNVMGDDPSFSRTYYYYGKKCEKSKATWNCVQTLDCLNTVTEHRYNLMDDRKRKYLTLNFE